jgi:hypothetical protein
MKNSSKSRFGPFPIVLIHVLAFIGVLFWLSTMISAIVDGSDQVWFVIALGVVLGGAHIAISLFTSRHNRGAVMAMWFVLISDSLLTIFVSWLAIVLVMFTVVLLILTRTPSARKWFASRN